MIACANKAQGKHSHNTVAQVKLCFHREYAAADHQAHVEHAEVQWKLVVGEPDKDELDAPEDFVDADEPEWEDRSDMDEDVDFDLYYGE